MLTFVEALQIPSCHVELRGGDSPFYEWDCGLNITKHDGDQWAVDGWERCRKAHWEHHELGHEYQHYGLISEVDMDDLEEGVVRSAWCSCFGPGGTMRHMIHE